MEASRPLLGSGRGSATGLGSMGGASRWPVGSTVGPMPTVGSVPMVGGVPTKSPPLPRLRRLLSMEARMTAESRAKAASRSVSLLLKLFTFVEMLLDGSQTSFVYHLLRRFRLILHVDDEAACPCNTPLEHRKRLLEKCFS